ncbi:MAG: PilN domain-containing protein [Solirubrobacteraceae bacterium]
MKAVNLIPNEQRAAARPASGAAGSAPAAGSALGAYVVLGVLAFAIVAAALYVMAGNSIKENQAELSRVEQEATTIELQASSLQSFADFQQLASTRLATVEALAGSRFDWSATLDDVSRRLPSNVFISSFDGSTLSSTGGSSLRGAITAPSIELNGCTSDQVSVARLMSRLRDVRGVTRVSLAKSEASDTVATAVAPAPATAAGDETLAAISEACPEGSPPAFDVIVFFERAAVNAAAAPNAAAISGGVTGPTGPTGAAGATTSTSTTTTTP